MEAIDRSALRPEDRCHHFLMIRHHLSSELSKHRFQVAEYTPTFKFVFNIQSFGKIPDLIRDRAGARGWVKWEQILRILLDKVSADRRRGQYSLQVGPTQLLREVIHSTNTAGCYGVLQ
jgi:hypothetical protein